MCHSVRSASSSAIDRKERARVFSTVCAIGEGEKRATACRRLR